MLPSDARFIGQILYELYPLRVSLERPSLHAHTHRKQITVQMRSLLPLFLMWYHFTKYYKWIIYAKNTKTIAVYLIHFIWAHFQYIRDIIAFDAHMKVISFCWHQGPLLQYWLGNRLLQVMHVYTFCKVINPQPASYCKSIEGHVLTELEFPLDICQGA